MSLRLPHSLVSLWPHYRRFFSFSRQDTSYILICALAILGIAITNTLIIWLISQPLNELQAGAMSAIPMWLAWIGLAVVINQGCHFATDTLSGWLELRFIKRVRAKMLARCMLVSFPIMDNYPKGDLIKRLSQDLDALSQFVLRTLFMSLSHVLILTFYISMLFWIDWPLAAFALACSPVFLVHQGVFGRRKQEASQKFLTFGGRLMSFEAETLANLRGISSFHVEQTVSTLHQSSFEKARKWAMRNKILDASFNASLLALIYLGALAIVLGGMFRIDSGDLDVGRLVSFLLYLGYLSVPVRGLAQLALQCHQDQAAAVRIAEVLDLRPMIEEKAGAPPLEVNRGHIAMDRVTFAYPGGQTVMRDFSGEIFPGETVALVGPSGAGKSTLIKLLARFYDPQEGRISVDGSDIRTVSVGSLRSHIAVVWQEPFLINDTVANNLRLARPEATDEQMVAACRVAHAWEFVENLPQRLQTVLGADGVDLSAGQKQRLTIAQAFLRDAPILVLDEASSALDSQAEKLITDALDHLRQGRTTIIIAHRFSAIRGAQRVFFFNGDGTVTVGTHNELYASHPKYRAAIEWQTGENPQ